jgi:prepilin-type N-terminal cleavage/methylation domain-containing protein
VRGVTLAELLIVLVIVGITASIVVPPLGRSLDRAAVGEGAERYEIVHETARAIAVARGHHVRVELDSARHAAVIAMRVTPSQWDTLQAQPLGRASFSASRVIVTFSPLGIGFGASNTSIVFTSGTAADTVTVSRTGRLKRY